MFLDRLLGTPVHLRHGVIHDVLACWFGAFGSTITRAVGEVRRLLAERGCPVAGGIRLRTLTDVIAHLGATGQLGLLDAIEVRVRRLAAGRAGRQRFVSGKARANTVKALVITDAAGRLLFCGQTRRLLVPGAIDQSRASTVRTVVTWAPDASPGDDADPGRRVARVRDEQLGRRHRGRFPRQATAAVAAAPAEVTGRASRGGE